MVKRRGNGTLTTGEAGELLGVSRRTVAFWVQSGKLKAGRTEGNASRIPLQSIIDCALDGDIQILRSAIPYSDAELASFGISTGKLQKLKKGVSK